MCDVKWRRMYDKFPSHENNRAHRDCYWKWNNLQCSIMAAKGTDHHLQRQMQSETERNIALLERPLDVTLHLASRNLPFRGKTEKLGDVHNGNYLGTLELVSHYDALLKEHRDKVRNSTKETRLTHYLSSDIQNEFIELCGKRVLQSILREKEDAIYYSIICDATPDICLFCSLDMSIIMRMQMNGR